MMRTKENEFPGCAQGPDPGGCDLRARRCRSASSPERMAPSASPHARRSRPACANQKTVTISARRVLDPYFSDVPCLRSPPKCGMGSGKERRNCGCAGEPAG